LHILQKELFNIDERRFVFNMSVGYDLKGIQSPKVDGFVEGLKDASHSDFFKHCKQVLLQRVGLFKNVTAEYIAAISPHICSSITLSTMHGCPPADIEEILKYLLEKKKLHTFVKMNPTLLGFQVVRETFDRMGYKHIVLKEESFTHDLQYSDGVALLHRLEAFSKQQGRKFGVKLSNTLPVRITKGELPGDEMYMSGRALYPLTINLAYKLAEEFSGALNISYSGGADFFNVERIFATGIRPITFATTLLKPGGYTRLKQIAESLEPSLDNAELGKIDLEKLKSLAESAFVDVDYLKDKRPVSSRKLERKLPLTDCFVAPCAAGCPIEQDISEYIRLVNEENFAGAFAVIVRKNPLPFITGTICNHKCMTKCTRLDYEESVHIRDIKLRAAENGFESYLAGMQKNQQSSGTKIAVIGAGPTGLAAAYFLAKAGLEVTVFEKRLQAGGTVRNVIPDFRIAQGVIDKDIELVKRAGVKFEFGAAAEFSVEALKQQGFKYVFVAIGAGKSGSLALQGDANKVKGAISFLEEFKQDPHLRLGKNVAVIGGGDSAIDAARAAKRVKNVEQVFILYRRTKEYMPADREELNLALAEGVIFKELLAPISLYDNILKCQKQELGPLDASGRRSPIPTAEFLEINIDTVLSATGEQVEHEVLRKNGINIDDNSNLQVVADTLETNLPNVFVGGDALYGPATVVEGIAHATKVCKAILAKEATEAEKLLPQEHPVSGKDLERIAERKGVLSSYCSVDQEPKRCLECNIVCNICTEVCPNRANISLVVSSKGLTDQNQILHVDGLCNECGNCATFCPYNGAPYQGKLTLFWTEKDFENSSNPGFLLLEAGAEPRFKVRIEDSTSNVRFNSQGQADQKFDESIAAMLWSAYTTYNYLF
jgi:putative selenate reductase